ncbi:2Fe-2S iron-sulfur cluster binding domain-containing protein [Micromonospora sp. ANENR4]|uniref:(2Fe-2S)-binding protein n=1 Tax=unclassified Micromonospora TaxID=2617518 RepID=UPI00188F453F|nr:MULTISPECIES: 2Fe-2S iron-sulfur cluster-binding protein [unclassified Micromonospora]MBF5033659.1 2Fe-2S iron-sulfur cluster binding domain-containing protein [Micromonospora sp. ANENR4]MCZ7476266.1 2Fe-2S iron-sulfur cluster-binding protein [Micromonospora sp. WMMC273]
MRLTMKVNGRPVAADGVAPERSLLRLLRDDLGLTGTKDACEQGECGSCTVLLDGGCVNACLVPAGQADGGSVETVEGLVDVPAVVLLREAFLAAGAVQCGFCTPGLLVAAQELMSRRAEPSDNDIREALAGNLCRCTGYVTIIHAVRCAWRAGREVR